MSSPENALVQADKSKIDDGHPSGQNDWGVAALFNMITPHFFEYHRYSSSIRIEDVQNQQYGNTGCWVFKRGQSKELRQFTI